MSEDLQALLHRLHNVERWQLYHVLQTTTSASVRDLVVLELEVRDSIAGIAKTSRRADQQKGTKNEIHGE